MAALMRRYGVGARWYDVLSGERPVYRAGRQAGIALLALSPGDCVVDLGCGTGLNFALLLEATAPSGIVIGVDRSPDMLAMAQRRVDREGWGGRVRLIRADAAELLSEAVAQAVIELRGGGDGRADALLATYALSVITEREEAWRRARATLRPGARASIVDMQPPHGFWRVLSPLARLACATGGADISARPWRMLERDAVDPSSVRRVERKGGHIVAVAATVSASDVPR
ncbi:methyltransferase domain-containing protein [Microbacterium foliorum]|uniref:class I SAM-dependent methyltransferase n=1 Tax=Microbacterium foliorum TaxID=104336 RepID=UPI0028D275D3|nr:methyltransferase domain-containing protein [Microbacterium foliorum]